MTINDEKSIEMVYRLLHEEGLYLGASSALNVVAAYELAKKLGPGSAIFYWSIQLRCMLTWAYYI